MFQSPLIFQGKALLFGSLLLLFIPISIHAQEKGSGEVSILSLWKNEPFGSQELNKELVAKRDAFSKHFRNANGTFAAHIASGPIHYKEDGQWKTIFHTISPSNNGFENVHNSHKTYFPATSSRAVTTILPGGETLKDMMAMRMYYQSNGQEIQAQSIQDKPGTAIFNELTYSNVYGSGIDLRLTQQTTLRKMDYLIQSVSALGNVPAGAEFLVFEEAVELPTGWKAELKDNVIFLLDIHGKIQAKYEKPVFSDTPAGHYHNPDGSDEASESERIQEGNYQISEENGKLTIKMLVPINWLLASERNFPVIIDPTANFYVNTASLWTGTIETNGTSPDKYTTTSGTTQYDGSYRAGLGIAAGTQATNLVNHPWAKFSISSLPSGATVSAVDLNLRHYASVLSTGTCRTDVSFRHIANEPVAATAANRLTDIRDGNVYATYSYTNANTGTATDAWDTYSLGNGANTHLQSNIGAGWFAVGLNTTGAADNDDRVRFRSHLEANKPYIAVTYCVTPANVSAGSDAAFCSGGSTALSGTHDASPTVTVFRETFESYGDYNVTTTSGPWKVTVNTASGWAWEIWNACTAAEGSRCLGMYDAGNTHCDYQWNDDGNKIAWYDNPISTVGMTNTRLSFKWKCAGQTGIDYGTVVYSLNGTTWTDLPTLYQGQTAWQTVSNLDFSAVNGQSFYLGFRFQNNNSTGTLPGFIIDDITITAQPVYTYSWSPATGLSNTAIVNPTANPTSNTTYTFTVTQGACSAADQVAITVSSAPAIASLSAPAAICTGGSLNPTAPTVTPNGATVSAQGWQLETAVSSGTYSNITIPYTVNTGDHGKRIRYYATNSCGTTYGNTPSISVDALSNGGTVSSSQTICYGASPNTVTLSGNTGSVTKWQYNNGSWNDIGATAGLSSYSPGSLSATTQYRAVVQNGACAAANSAGITITVPSFPTSISGSTTSSCVLNSENNWVYFVDGGTVLAAVRDNSGGSNMGNTSVTVYNHGSVQTYVGENYMTRVTSITPSSNAPSRVRLYFTEAQFLALKASKPAYSAYNYSNLRVTKFPGAITTPSGTPVLMSSTFTQDGFGSGVHYIEFDVSSYSTFFIHFGDTSPLPISLVSFSASCSQQQEVDLNWKTASEHNSEKFIVEKSRDLQNWVFVSELQAAGNSNVDIDYHLPDEDVYAGTSYYRLTQQDFNGEEKIYAPVSVSCKENSNNIQVFPNPSKGDFTVEVSSYEAIQNATLHLMDMTGKIITEKQLNVMEGKNQVLFENLELPMGTYLVKLVSGTNFKPVKLMIN